MKSLSHPLTAFRVLCFSLALALWAACCPALSAQAFYGSVLGNVQDASGAVVVGASVTLVNVGTSVQSVAKTDGRGNFEFLSLYPGNYKLDIVETGFKHFTRASIKVEIQNAVRVDAQLMSGDVSETVTVTAPSTQLETASGTVGTVVEGRAVEELPLNGRNLFNLLELVPGVVAQGGAAGNATGNAQNGYTNPNGWGNYQIGGGNAGQSATLVDGASVNITYLNATAFIPTQDAVQEFKVATNSVSPEFGRYSGGVVNLITKSGTNAFHGSAYEYFRNKALNANTWANDGVGLPKAQFQQNQFGANIGGPIIEEKAFGFFSWEEYALRQGISIVDTVPTAAEKSGDFRQTGEAIYDPYTFQPIQCNGVLNTICPNRIDPVAAAALFYWPTPSPNANNSAINNYTGIAKVGGNNTEYNARLDYHLSDKQQLFARYSHWAGTGISSNPYHNITGNPNTAFTSQQVVLGDTYALNNTTVLDARASYLRFSYKTTPLSLGQDLGHYGANLAAAGSQFFASTAPAIVVTGMSNDIFSNMELLIDSTNNNYAGALSLTKVAGKHTMKFGGELRQLDWSFVQSNFPTAGFGFSGAYTALGDPNVQQAQFHAFADYLLGFPIVTLSQQSSRAGMLQTYQGYYATDTYQVAKNFTINYGIRWELPGAFKESHDRATVLLPDAKNALSQQTGIPFTGALALVNSQQAPDRHTQTVKYDLFAPRVGFAYSIGKNTVLRGGFGINHLPNDVAFNEGAWASPINSAQTSIYNNIPLVNTLSNPFPNGVLQPGGRSENLSLLQGQTVQSPVLNQPFAYVEQWNLNLQRQLGTRTLVQVGYVASKGTHLPYNSIDLDQLPDKYFSMGAALNTPVANPFAGLLPGSQYNGPTIPQGQLLRPFPQYSDVVAQGYNAGSSNYQAMQSTVQQQLPLGATVIASYTFSKFLGNVDSLQSFLEQGNPGGIQDNTNLATEWSLTSYDVPQRFTLGYTVDLPFGRGKKFLSNVTGIADKLGSGWGLGGITTLQSGFPLALSETETNFGLASLGVGGLRPNVVPGCSRTNPAPALSKLNKWFNTACFAAPSDG